MTISSEQQQIATLKRAWETAYPQSAAGGRLALSGFHYQFLSALLSSIKAWRQKRTERDTDDGPRVFAETLSDLVETEGDAIIVTQLKRSLARGDKVKGALRDLWSVHITAIKATHDLLPKLQYRIQTARGDPEMAKAAIERWKPAPSDTDADIETGELARFLGKVQAEILNDPENELLTLLANHPFRDRYPLARIRSWLGRLIAAADGGPEGYENAATEIWNDLQNLGKPEQQYPSGIYFWNTTDRPPDTVTEGQVLFGQRPRAHQLKEGFFAPREPLYTKLVESVENWALGDEEEPDPTIRLRLFWIGGRSGCGKSVALLHVLGGLHERGFAPFLFLGNRPELLPDAVRWCRNIQGLERQPLIALDDPYAPNAQENDALWDSALVELEDLRQQGNGEVLPLLVCCGPTEQAEQLQENNEEHLWLEIFELPREEPNEIRVLRGWYRARTGKEPPALEQDADVLLVQLFFEWHTGKPIPEFAKRLRERIRTNDDDKNTLGNLLSRVFSLNRLYAGYPKAAMDVRLDTGLRWLWDLLREENHIAEYDDADRQGVWISHPHLANAIFDAWYPPTKKHHHERAEHLKAALLDALAYGETPSEKTAPLWSLSRALAPNDRHPSEEGDRQKIDRISQRIDPEQTRQLLREIHAARAHGGHETMPISEFPVWIQLMAQVLALQLSPDPIDAAIRRIGDADPEEQGLRLTCHKLLQYRERFDKSRQACIVEAIIDLLRRIPEWREWAPVALDALWLRTGQTEIARLVADWIPKHVAPIRAGSLLLRALRIAPNDEALLGAAKALLTNAPASFDWGYRPAIAGAREHITRRHTGLNQTQS
uniref:Uncharacterized protein n=1 Tax=Candidatus Kentrum sp. MB TaxID=2138164 RepID=A0A450X6P2_9GAMM|nr:MAG: hypothetical protein BECKMB1821G_GA0114241_101066 [Candidatus Kentron sp. MB]